MNYELWKKVYRDCRNMMEERQIRICISRYGFYGYPDTGTDEQICNLRISRYGYG